MQSNEDVVRAARMAHLDGFIESLPEGLQTVVGEAGARLSSGEAQRLNSSSLSSFAGEAVAPREAWCLACGRALAATMVPRSSMS